MGQIREPATTPAPLKSGTQSSTPKAPKRRNRNLGAELRVIESRGENDAERGLSPVSKSPSISFNRSFSAVSMSQTMDESEDEEDQSVVSQESMQSYDSIRARQDISLSPRFTKSPEEELQKGSFETLWNHPFLRKDKSTLQSSSRVRFEDDSESAPASSEEPNKADIARSTSKGVGGSLKRLVSRKKGTKKGVSFSSDEAIPNAAELLKDSSVDTPEIAAVLKESRDCPMSSSKALKSKIEATLSASERRKKHGGKKASVGAVDSKLEARVKELVEHAEKLVDEDNFEDATRVYLQVVEKYAGAGYTESNEDVQATIKKIRETHHRYKSVQNADKILMMGQDQETRGRYVRACKFYTVSYRIRKDALGPKHPSLVNPLNLLASLLGKRGQYDDAMKFLQMAVELHSDNKGGIEEMAVTTRNLGQVVEEMDQFDQALQFYQNSLVLHKKSIGMMSDDSKSDSVPYLDDLMMDWPPLHVVKTNDDPGVEVFTKSSIGMFTVDQPKDTSPTSEAKRDAYTDLAITLNCIGRILSRRYGQLTAAMEVYMNSLAWMKAAVGKEHPNVASLLGNIGNLCKEIGDYERAFCIYQEVLRMEKRFFGGSHPEVAVTLHNIGTIQYGRGKYREALKSFQEAMKIQKSVYGVDSALVSMASSNVGEVSEKMKDYSQAVLAYQVSLEIDMITMGKTHPLVGRMKHKIGKIYFRHLDKVEEADELFLEASVLYKANGLCKNHPFFMEVQRDLADVKAVRQFSVSEDMAEM